MNGAYKHFYFRSTDSFVSEPYYSVVVYKDGIKNDTVRHYSISSHCMTSRIITLDSICELYQSYYSNGYPHIFTRLHEVNLMEYVRDGIMMESRTGLNTIKMGS